MHKIMSMMVSLMLVIAMAVPFAYAAEPRVAGVTPSLSFDRDTAICSVTCRGNNSSDELDVVMTLYQGSRYIDSWSRSGTGRVILTGECSVDSGLTYTLKIDFSINGQAKPSVSTSNTCHY